MLLQPKEVQVKLPNGGEKTYVISKFPATVGREIISKYPVANMPKLGDYKVSEDVMLLLMSHVAVKQENGNLKLSTKDLVNNHVPDWEVLTRLEGLMMEYNCSFFENGQASIFLQGFAQKAQEWITRILTTSSAQSSPTAKQL